MIAKIEYDWKLIRWIPYKSHSHRDTNIYRRPSDWTIHWELHRLVSCKYCLKLFLFSPFIDEIPYWIKVAQWCWRAYNKITLCSIDSFNVLIWLDNFYRHFLFLCYSSFDWEELQVKRKDIYKNWKPEYRNYWRYSGYLVTAKL